jgi:hypothetical protein
MRVLLFIAGSVYGVKANYTLFYYICITHTLSNIQIAFFHCNRLNVEKDLPFNNEITLRFLSRISSPLYTTIFEKCMHTYIYIYIYIYRYTTY